VGGVARDHDRLQGWRGKRARRGGRSRAADRVADPRVAEPPELADLARGHRRAPGGPAAIEYADRGDFCLLALAEPHAISHADRSRKQTHIRDLLAGRAALDFEHAARNRAI